jgi:hypothetical protein
MPFPFLFLFIHAFTEANLERNDSPANLIKRQGVFWSMLKNTGEYDELIQMVRE